MMDSDNSRMFSIELQISLRTHSFFPKVKVTLEDSIE